MPPFPQAADEESSNTIASRSRSPLTFFVLVFALMAFCPAIAASILVHREHKTAGVTELLQRAFDYKRIRAKVWYAPIVLLMPGVMVLSYELMRVMGLPLPTPQFSVLAALVMVLAFFIGAVGEELGWSGYVIDPMQERWNALQASILLRVVWATWHIVPGHRVAGDAPASAPDPGTGGGDVPESRGGAALYRSAADHTMQA